ncbi:MAG: GNAT family protein [Pseudomonadota bacterium]
MEDKFVCLHPMNESHREALRPLAAEEELWALTTTRGDGPYFDAWFNGRLHAQKNGTAISYAVWVKNSGAFGGHTSYLGISSADARVEVGWTWYAAPYRGTAVNPACKHLLLGHAFKAGAKRVELKTHGKNERSQRAMKKMGATYEGTHRSNQATWTGERRDTVYFSILEEEWPEVRDGLRERLAAHRE